MIILGNCRDELKKIEDESIDSLITDPPAGISFMGKSWDKDKGGRDAWIEWLKEIMQECLRVLKPGAHGLVWALPRTSHWTATALEDAGFEIRDSVVHVFGSGFPKSQNIGLAIDKQLGAKRKDLGPNPNRIGRTQDIRGNGLGPATAMGIGKKTDAELLTRLTEPATEEAKKWDGFGTALKPAHENWILIRKPISEKTVAKNVLKHGCGGLNIDASRIETNKNDKNLRFNEVEHEGSGVWLNKKQTLPHSTGNQGRFPANLVLSEEAAQELDEHSGISKSTGGRTVKRSGKYEEGKVSAPGTWTNDDPGFGDIGGASRFFYVAKAPKSDKGTDNTHPTVKSTKLMEYLIKLITPPGGMVLDPFMGSASTGVAAKRLGFEFIGIEQEQEYYNIALKRLAQ